MNCPRCGYSRVSSNKIIPISDERYAQGAHVVRATGMPALTAGLMAVWAVHRAINAARHEYRCDHCNHGFS